MDSPILKINGKRYTMGKLKAGTYRQIVLLGDDLASENCKDYTQDDIIEEARLVIQSAFNLTAEQSEQIEMDTIMPTFRKIKALAEALFIERAAEVPNAEGPGMSDPGQN